MKYKYVTTKRVNATLWVEINNPPVNFLTANICNELFHLVKQVNRDPTIRVFIITGGIEDNYIFHFSIPELKKITADNKRILMDRIFRTRIGSTICGCQTTFTNWLMDLFPWYETLILKLTKIIRGYSSTLFLWFQMHRLYFAVERMKKITIAAINGSCNGGGTELSACFDFRFMISDQNFTIGQPEILVGIIPGGGGSQRLPRLIGKAKALELMLTANQLTPEEAKRIGLITDSFKKTEFFAKVQEFADIMSKRIPVAVDGIKRAVHQGMEANFRHALSLEMGHTVRCFDDKITRKAFEEYSKIIKERIEEPKGKRGTVIENLLLMQSDEIIRRIMD